MRSYSFCSLFFSPIYTILLLFLLLGFSAAHSCGNIQNIACPFVLRGTSKSSCQSSTYELFCENNANTLVSIYNGTYIVQAINYNNFTLRVTDPGIKKSDCSSIPKYPLSLYNFSNGGNFTMMDLSNSDEATFISCQSPISEDPRFVSRSSCLNKSSSSLSYDYVLGESRIARVMDIPNSCRVDTMTVVERSAAADHQEQRSVSDVYEKLSYGFEMSFYESNCRKCRTKGYKFAGKDERTRCRLICGAPPDRILPEWQRQLRFIVTFYVPWAVTVFLVGRFVICGSALLVVICIHKRWSKKKRQLSMAA